MSFCFSLGLTHTLLILVVYYFGFHIFHYFSSLLYYAHDTTGHAIMRAKRLAAAAHLLENMGLIWPLNAIFAYAYTYISALLRLEHISRFFRGSGDIWYIFQAELVIACVSASLQLDNYYISY